MHYYTKKAYGSVYIFVPREKRIVSCIKRTVQHKRRIVKSKKRIGPKSQYLYTNISEYGHWVKK